MCRLLPPIQIACSFDSRRLEQYAVVMIGGCDQGAEPSGLEHATEITGRLFWVGASGRCGAACDDGQEMDVDSWIRKYCTTISWNRENCCNRQEDTLRLEAEPGNEAALASIFRAFHTIKGGAGFLEAANLVAWAHDLENLLDKLRSHALPVTFARIDAILRGIDTIDAMFQELALEIEPSPGPAELSSRIRALAEAESAENRSSA